MTLQWTLIAVFLYVEIGFLALLMLPWIRPPVWQKIFKSRLVKAIESYSNIFWYSFGGILILLFFDAVREVMKYSKIDNMPMEEKLAIPNAEAMMHMRLFRAQRNLYIAGFAVFLYLVARRMVQMIIREAQLMASAEASMKQAQGASAAAQSMLKDTKAGTKSGDKEGESSELKALENTISLLKKELTKVEADRDTMKEQAEGVKREYDRLLKEFQEFQEGLVDPDKDD